MARGIALQRLQRSVRTLAVTLGALITVTVPSGLGYQAYMDSVERRQFQAQLAAERIAQYAYIQGPTWRFSQNRVGEMIAFVVFPGDVARIIVYAAGNDEVVAFGTTHAGPSSRSEAPVIVRTERVGTVAIEASLLPLLAEIALLALIGAALGTAVYVGVHLLPLRALRRAEAVLDATEADLRAQITKTKTALSLAQAQREQAEMANRTKSEFLANMSHELRTPLNAIIGFSDVMRGELFGKLPDRYKAYVQDIHGSSIHLLQIINELLDLAKIEAGQVELDLGSVDVHGLIDGCCRLMRERAIAAGLKLSIDREDLRAPAITVDEVKAKQILLNLLSNAIKFTPKGSVALSARSLDDDWVEISVVDTGIGMTADEIMLALEPFRQVDSSLGRKYEGTGLGLPLAKALAELHGGILSVVSSPGRGTTVTVRLPVTYQVPAETTPRQQVAAV